MRPSDVVARGTEYLQRHGVEDARSSAEILMTKVLGTDRAGIYSRGEALTSVEARSYGRALCQRCTGVPVQHLTGDQPFRALTLEVRAGVFVPRPETEVLVDVALGALEDIADPVVVDVGTGTGAIALAIKSERPEATVFATDVSAEACALSADNADRLRLEITIHEGDLFEALPQDLAGRVDLIAGNPPYVTPDEYLDLPPEVKADPVDALVGGLPAYARLIEGAAAWLRARSALVVEIGADQATDVARLFAEAFEDVVVTQDLAGRDRIVSGRRR
ncbi:MAG: peptide chain release factor N(5)-glutamine methyltransferase [Actinomycetota bacterium]